MTEVVRKTLFQYPAFRMDQVVAKKDNLSLSLIFIMVLPLTLLASPSTTNSPLAGIPLASYNVVRWTATEGLPAGPIQALCQTRNGYLWIGTRNGLARFNGLEFKPIPRLNCISLVEDEEGTLWVGTTQGLFREENGKLYPFDLHPRKVKDPVRIFSMCPRAGGGIWVCDGDSLLSLRGKVIERFPGDRKKSQAMCLLDDGSGKVWLADPFPASRWQPGNSDLEVCPGLPALAGKAILTMNTDSKGGLWFGGRGLEAFYVREGATQCYIGPREFRSQSIFSMAEDSRNTLWIGNDAGLWQIGTNGITRPLGLEGASFGTIHRLAARREGGIWVGTDQNGLFLVERKQFLALTRDNGLVDNNVWSISQGPDQSVWIGTKGGLSHLSNGHFENFTTEHGLNVPFVRSVLVDRGGRVWAGTHSEHGVDRGTLHVFHTNGFVSLEKAIGVQFEGVNSLSQGEDCVWISGSGKLYQWLAGNIAPVLPEKVSGESVFVDREQNVWLGSGSLYRVRDNQFTQFGKVQGLPPGFYAVMHEDEAGALWIVSSDKGLFRFKDGQFKNINAAHGLPSNLNLSLLEDAEGRYWFNCYNGVYWVAKKELNEVADGKRKLVRAVIYGLEDGLPGLEGNGGNTPNACKASDGALWFPTTKGVAVIHPKEVPLDAQPLPVVVEQIRANGEILFSNLPEQLQGPAEAPVESRRDTSPGKSRLVSELRLQPGSSHSLVINYSAPNFLSPERTRYRVRLEGRDSDWIDARSQTFAQWDSLRPGHYVFHVTACDQHGVWNTTGAQLAFYIPSFFYQTWAFYTLCGASLLGGVTGLQGYRLSVQRRILGLEREAALARERERIARDMHDDLGASLTRIARLSQNARTEMQPGQDTVEKIEKISSAANQLVDSIGELVWATNPKYDHLESTVAYFREYAVQYFADLSIKCVFHYSAVDSQGAQATIAVTANLRRQLFLVLKEALHNISKHAQATSVEIRLALANKKLEMIITDNGQGMSVRDTPAFHHGFINMRERMTSLSGMFEIRSEPGKGATIYVSAPLYQ
jgi:signal transduction histidine kinase/ligand-binding sensor domain-containing protein